MVYGSSVSPVIQAVDSVDVSARIEPTFYDGIAIFDDYSKPKEVGEPI